MFIYDNILVQILILKSWFIILVIFLFRSVKPIINKHILTTLLIIKLIWLFVIGSQILGLNFFFAFFIFFIYLIDLH